MRREKTELESTNTQLEKQVRTARTKLTDTARNLKEMRQQASAKDRELEFSRKKTEKMEGRVQQLECELRSVAHNNHVRPVSPQPSTNLDKEAVDAANINIEMLEKEMTALRQSLQSEARTSEEQRVYIAVLENAVQAKAGEMGLDKGQADLLTKLARLQGELAAREREREQSESALKAFEAEMEDLRAREEMQEQQSSEQETKIRQLSDRLTQFGRGEDDLLNAVKTLESEKTALLDYVEDNATRVAELSHQVQKLEADKLESERERQQTQSQHRQLLSEATSSKELLQIKTAEAQAAYVFTYFLKNIIQMFFVQSLDQDLLTTECFLSFLFYLLIPSIPSYAHQHNAPHNAGTNLQLEILLRFVLACHVLRRNLSIKKMKDHNKRKKTQNYVKYKMNC